MFARCLPGDRTRPESRSRDCRVRGGRVRPFPAKQAPCRDFVRFAVRLEPYAHVFVIDRVRHGRTHEGLEDCEAMAGPEHVGPSPLMQTGADRARRSCRLGVPRARDGRPLLKTGRRAGRPSAPARLWITPAGVDYFTTATRCTSVASGASIRKKYTPEATRPFVEFDPSQATSCWPAERNPSRSVLTRRPFMS